MGLLRKAFIFLFPLLLLLPAKQAAAVPLGPFDVTLELCQKVQFVTSVVNAWANATFPVTGQPGFVVMMVQNTNPLLSTCDFLIQLQNSTTTEAIFLAADKLNEITEEKWDDHLKLVKKTHSLANSVYDLESGQHRSGTIDAVSLATEVGDFQRMITEMYTGNNPQAVKRRQQNDARIAELAQIAHARAILKEGTTCPDPKTDTDFYKVVEKDFAPRQKVIQTTEQDISFIRSQLIELGPRFLRDSSDVEKYYEEVQNLFVLGVTYRVSESKQTKTTVKPTGDSEKDGTAVRKDAKIEQVIQSFSALTNTQVFSEFRQKYERRYIAWVNEYWSLNSGTESGMQLLEDVFTPLSYECNETKIMRGYESLSGDEYERKRLQQFKACESSNKVDHKKAASLLGVYVNTLRDSLYTNKKAQGEIWSLESKHLGRKRSVATDKAGSLFQESVVCEALPEDIDLEMIQAKQQQVNARYNEIIARETLKEAMLRDEEIRRQQDLANQSRQKKIQIDRENRASKDIIAVPVSPDLGGSL